jgi:hypothetical protein
MTPELESRMTIALIILDLNSICYLMLMVEIT